MWLAEMETVAGCEYPGNIYEKVIHCFIDHKSVCHSQHLLTVMLFPNFNFLSFVKAKENGLK